jgi:hypothetical protein
MTRKNKDALLRSDRILLGALVMVFTVASAAVGAAAAYRPHADDIAASAAVRAPAIREDAAMRARYDEAAVTPETAAPEPALPLFRTAAERQVFDKLLREHRCLSEAIYYEARGEGVSGEKAVAEVIFHRIRKGSYGSSICGVVFNGANRPGCQFSFACNGTMHYAKSPQAWMQAQLLAARILTGEERLSDSTGGATSYHATSVQPIWAAELVRTVQIGNHVFYKHPSGARTM